MEVNIMAILGLLLLLSAAGLAVDMVVENNVSSSVDALGETFSLTPGWLFVAGVATGVIAMLGVSMLVAGMARARRRRSALVDTRSSVQDLQAERDRLAVELERERAARTATTVGPRRHDGPAHGDDEAGLIDLADERHPERDSEDYAGVPDATDRHAGDRREAVESGRRGLFQRRH
jgi:hypothetical protein